MKKTKIIELKLVGIQPILDKLDQVKEEFDMKSKLMEDKFRYYELLLKMDRTNLQSLSNELKSFIDKCKKQNKEKK